jgi:L-rhamnose 1-dehydrogenase
MTSQYRVADKRVLVTGASRGIGLAIAQAFAACGARVLMHCETLDDRDTLRASLETSEQGSGSVSTLVADFRRTADVQGMIDEAVNWAGGIDVLVNNAGVCPFRPVLEISIEEWDNVFAINTRAMFLITQAIARDMVERQIRGSVIVVGSVGAYAGGDGQTHYNASKAAAQSVVRSMAVELGQYGLRFNSVLPGCVHTAINAAVPPARFDAIAARVPLGRIGEMRDVVGAVLFLASDESGYYTGAEIRVDGGVSVNF